MPSQQLTEHDYYLGWHRALAKIQGNPRLVVKSPALKQPTDEEQAELDAIEGERIKAIFQANINARCPNFDKTAIARLLAMFPGQLSVNKGKWISRSFDRNIEACSNNKRLRALYSRDQIIAFAAAKTLEPLLDYEPNNFHSLFAMCCRFAKTHEPAQIPESEYMSLRNPGYVR